MAETILGRPVEMVEADLPTEPITVVDAIEGMFQIFKQVITSQPNDLGMTELVERYG